MATYTAYFNGVDKSASNVLLEGFSIREVTNGINTLVCDVESADASYRPLKRQTIDVYEDDGSSPVHQIFGGLIKSVRERGFGQPADGIDDIVMSVTADSYRQLAERRFVDEVIPAGTLKAALQVLEPYLNTSPYFVTLDPAQVDGPTLDAIEFKVTRVDDALNFLATLTAKYGAPFTWTISYDKVLGMYQTGTQMSPWDLIEGDGTEAGDVEVEPTDDEYANKIILVGGNGQVTSTSDAFAGDGVTNVFPLTYDLVGPIPGVGYGAVGQAIIIITSDSPPSTETLAEVGLGYAWSYDPVTNSVSRLAGAPPIGFTFSVPYDGQLLFTVVAQDAGEIALYGLWEDKILAPELTDPVLAQSVADAELARRLGTGKIVRFRTRRIPCVVPGETITITVPKRNLSGSFTVTDVATDNEPGGATDDGSPSAENNLIRTVTCNNTIHEQEHQTLTRWWSEKDTTGMGTVLPPGSGAVGPAPPPYSTQYNKPPGVFGGNYNVLNGPLFYDQPDTFLGEEKNWGLSFVAGSALYEGTSPPGGSPYFQPGGWGPDGYVGLDDQFRLEMGILGSGDFSMDLFAPSDETVSPPTRYQSSILMNSVGDITLTAATPDVDGFDGKIALVGKGLPDGGPFADPPTDPEGISLIPGNIGESYTRLHKLNILDSLCGAYRTVTTSPWTLNTDGTTNTNEILTVFVNSGTGTINLPETAAPALRTFPQTLVGRLFFIKNIHASGTVTIDPFGGETIEGAANLTLPPGDGILIHRFDTSGWKVLLATPGVAVGSGVTVPGADKDVIFNDGGVLGVDTGQFTYDKTKDQLALEAAIGNDNTQLRITSGGEDGGIIGIQASPVLGGSPPGDYSGEITFGRETINGVDTARRVSPSYFWAIDTGGNAVDDTDGIGAEVNPGQTQGNPMAYTLGRGFYVSETGQFWVYQYGGLGTGAKPGCGLLINRNDSGSGAAAYLMLEDKNGGKHYVWFDATGAPRTSSVPPEEDGTPSDTSGTLLTASGVTVITALAADPGGPSDGDVWVRAAGTTPTRNLELRIRDGGVSYTIASVTV